MTNATEYVTIERRYRGPPDSANGGYACGLLGKRVNGEATVRLNVPPPLERPLSIVAEERGRYAMMDGEQVVAVGGAAHANGEIPDPVDFGVAVHASTKYRWSTGHPFAGCFVCGPERHAGDGLCIFPGAVDGREVVAAPWVPDATVCDGTARVRPEVIWAALDCPSWFGLLEFEPGAAGALLGELTARVVGRPAADEPCVVIGWSRGRDGRKLYGGAALYTSGGTLLGSSRATWIEPRAFQA